jgi:signal transduction histidine kinase
MTESLRNHIETLVRTERLALMGRLAAGIAHEVRNPLEAIKGATQVIAANDAAQETISKFTRIIRDEVAELNRFLEGFLDFARPAPLDLEPVAVNDVAEEVLGLVGPLLEKQRVRAARAFAERLPSVNADGRQIKQVVVNLCLNAVQAMPDGGVLTVATREAPAGGRRGVELLVSDTGPGVKAALREQIFEPFITTKAGGTGLGLAVSLGIIERHGGSISVEGEEGKGATFSVWLPAAEA